MNPGNVLYTGLALIFNLTICAALSFGGWAILQAAQADGKIDYCYTKISPGVTSTDYDVVGHRRWREDRILTNFKTVNDADLWIRQKCPNK